MDTKLGILFLLIATVITVSYLGEGGLRAPFLLARRRWRAIAPGRRKS